MIRKLTILDAIKSESPNLATINKMKGEDFSRELIMLEIKSLNLFLNVGKGMNEHQIFETSKIILGDYFFLKMEDFKIFFRDFKKGKYGQLFDRLDGMVILTALESYASERLVIAEGMSDHDHDRVKSIERKEQGLVNASASDMFSKIRKEIEDEFGTEELNKEADKKYHEFKVEQLKNEMKK